jgi:hypothetical protein
MEEKDEGTCLLPLAAPPAAEVQKPVRHEPLVGCPVIIAAADTLGHSSSVF